MSSIRYPSGRPYTLDWRCRPTTGGAPTWTPASDSLLQIWNDASDSATVVQSSGLISEWHDKSTHMRDSLQGDITYKPLYLTPGLNGLNTIQFHTQMLGVSATVISSAAPFGIHFVMKFDSINPAFNIFFTAQDGTNTPPYLSYNGSAWQFVGPAGSWQSVSGANSPGTTNFHVVQFMYDGVNPNSIGSFSIYVDGVATTLSSGGSDWGSPGTTYGGYNASGGPSNVVLQGQIAEAAITWDNTNRSSYYTYLSTKWAL